MRIRFIVLFAVAIAAVCVSGTASAHMLKVKRGESEFQYHQRQAWHGATAIRWAKDHRSIYARTGTLSTYRSVIRNHSWLDATFSARVNAFIRAAKARERTEEARRMAAASPQAVICQVFGAHCSKALSVARCESGFSVNATNGQYLGLFQMGGFARGRYGHGGDAWTQARAAYQYFLDAGWGPLGVRVRAWAPMMIACVSLVISAGSVAFAIETRRDAERAVTQAAHGNLAARVTKQEISRRTMAEGLTSMSRMMHSQQELIRTILENESDLLALYTGKKIVAPRETLAIGGPGGVPDRP